MTAGSDAHVTRSPWLADSHYLHPSMTASLGTSSNPPSILGVSQQPDFHLLALAFPRGNWNQPPRGLARSRPPVRPQQGRPPVLPRARRRRALLCPVTRSRPRQASA